jgi:hypothetical protein
MSKSIKDLIDDIQIDWKLWQKKHPHWTDNRYAEWLETELMAAKSEFRKLANAGKQDFPCELTCANCKTFFRTTNLATDKVCPSCRVKLLEKS